MIEHINVEVLADYAEDLLDRGASTRVSRHLDECPSCTERLAAIGDVSAYLSALPAPPMPPDIAARIESAIAEESRARSAQSAPADAQASPPAEEPAGAAVIPLRARSRSRSRRWMAPLTAAAAAVVVVGGGYAVVKQIGGGTTSANPTGPTTDATAREFPKSAPPDMMNSGTRYTSADLGAQVNSVMREAATGSSPVRPKSGKETPPPSMPAGTEACMDRIASKVGSGPVLVDSGMYEGRAAKIFVFKKTGTPSRYDVWIVDSTCSATIDGVVTHTSIPRHP